MLFRSTSRYQAGTGESETWTYTLGIANYFYFLFTNIKTFHFILKIDRRQLVFKYHDALVPSISMSYQMAQLQFLFDDADDDDNKRIKMCAILYTYAACENKFA